MFQNDTPDVQILCRRDAEATEATFAFAAVLADKSTMPYQHIRE